VPLAQLASQELAALAVHSNVHGRRHAISELCAQLELVVEGAAAFG
jgi:hypothetical protein